MATSVQSASETTSDDASKRSRMAHEHLWMHFTRQSTYANSPVAAIVRGEGARIFDANGKSCLDGLAGLYVTYPH
jgi:adenosylmethionine-8-amino-7-oxononanoate aminotransferase